MLLQSILISIGAFVLVTALIIIVGYHLLLGKRGGRRTEQERIRELAATDSIKRTKPDIAFSLVNILQQIGALFGSHYKPIDQIRLDLLRAGYFHSQAPQAFLGARWFLTVLLAICAIIASLSMDSTVRPLIGEGYSRTSKLQSFQRLGLCALLAGSFGWFAPGIYLASRVNKRQRLLRHAFPDALDMIVLCLESGATFPGAMQRVTDDLDSIHPELSSEMNIVQREMQLGLTAGDALRKFADRCGLSDVRDLALILLQSERYGASLSKTLRGFVESARQDRQQQMEEKAQKAAVKILFPTILCIFPAIFIVILGPAAHQIAGMFSR